MSIYFIWFFAVLGYLLAGLLYSVCYLWAYTPQKQTTELGLMVVAWPAYIVLGIVLQIAHALGKCAKIVNAKLVEGRIGD
jgi:hypothetical protein